MGAYKYQRTDVMSQEEVGDMILRAQRLWLKAFIAASYLTGGRVKELLMMRKKDVTVTDQTITFRIPTLKKRKTKGPFAINWREIVISRSSPFTQYVVDFVTAVKDPDTPLWPLGGTLESSRVIAWKELKALNPNCSPHLFRHTRLTKLALKGADEIDLMQWAGWADPRPAAEYVHLRSQRDDRFSQVD